MITVSAGRTVYRPGPLFYVVAGIDALTTNPARPRKRRRPPRHRAQPEVNMIAFIATLPAPLRHLVLAVASVLLAWGGTDGVGWLKDLPGSGALLAGLLAAVLAVITPLVNSYGVGARAARISAARAPFR